MAGVKLCTTTSPTIFHFLLLYRFFCQVSVPDAIVMLSIHASNFMINSFSIVQSFDILKLIGLLRRSIMELCTGKFEALYWKNVLVVRENLIVDVLIIS